MNLEEKGKEYAETLLDALEAAGISTELSDPQDAFESGTYYGYTKGFAKGVNQMFQDIPELLPDIFNQIADSGFDMKKDWVQEYRKLILQKLFDIST